MKVVGMLAAAVVMAASGGCVAKSKYNAQEKLARMYRKQAETYRKNAEQYQADLTKARSDLASFQQKYTDLKKSFANRLKASQQELEELAKARKEAEARARILRDLTSRFRKLIDAGTLSIQVVHGRMVLKLRSAVLFDSGKVMLKGKGQTVLGEIASALRGLSDRHFQVAGHTDNQPIRRSRFKSNWELSTARAVQVVRFLQKKGVSPSSLSVGGFGEFQPVADNKTPEGRQANRRIEITLIPSIPSQLLKM